MSELSRRRTDERQSAREATEPENDIEDIVLPNIPLSFREWSREHHWDRADATLDREIDGYVEYLRGFPDINYPDRFMDGAREILRDEYTALEFVPDDDSGRLMTFNTFIRTAVPPIPETFAHFGAGSLGYGRYLFVEGTLDHYWHFLNFRTRVAQDVREYLNTLTPTGAVAGWEGQERLQTFREWTASNIRVFDPEPSADEQLRLDLDAYEHSYLGLTADARVLLAFRDLRRRIRDNDIENFDFHTHTDGVLDFRQWLPDAIDPASTWNQSLEHYVLYLDHLGRPGLAMRFERARSRHALGDRRECEGRPREDPNAEPDIILDPTAASDDQLGSELLRIAHEFRVGLVQNVLHPPEVVSLGLLTLCRLLYRYNTATAAQRHLTLEEWDDTMQELGRIVTVFSPGPFDARPQAPERELAEAGQGRDPNTDNPRQRNSVSPLTSRTNGLVLEAQAGPAPTVPAPQTQLFTEPEGISHRQPGPAIDDDWVVVEPAWLDLESDSEESQTQTQSHTNPSSLASQLLRENRWRRDRDARRRERERRGQRPWTPAPEEAESESGSEVDEDELRARAMAMISDRMDE